MTVTELVTEAERDYKKGRLASAAQKFRFILEVDDKNVHARQMLAICLMDLGQYTEAQEQCNRALELGQELATTYAILGTLYARQRRFEEGVSLIRKAIELDPTLEKAIPLSAALIEVGQSQEAVSILQKALALNPKESLIRYNLSVAYARQGQHGNALREALCAFRLAPSFRTAMLVIASSPALRALYSLSVSGFLLLPFLTPLYLKIPLSIVAIGFLVRLLIRSSKQMHSIKVFLIIVIIASYVYDILFGL